MGILDVLRTVEYLGEQATDEAVKAELRVLWASLSTRIKASK